MPYNPQLHHRRSIRLRGFDYSEAGAYFVTICTYDKKCLFGEVVKNQMKLSEIGGIAEKCWVEIPEHFDNVELDDFVTMPNHVHGIIVLRDMFVRAQYSEPRQNRFQHVIPKSLGSIVRSYKGGVTRICHREGNLRFRWQRDFYEHVIRHDKDLNRIRDYIRDNPSNWDIDDHFPGNIRMDPVHTGMP